MVQNYFLPHCVNLSTCKCNSFPCRREIVQCDLFMHCNNYTDFKQLPDKHGAFHRQTCNPDLAECNSFKTQVILLHYSIVR